MTSAVVDLSGLNPLLPFMVVLNEGLYKAVLKEGGVDDGGSNNVWVHVACRSSVLNVALLLSSSGSGNSDRAGAGTNTIREDFFVGGLMVPC